MCGGRLLIGGQFLALSFAPADGEFLVAVG